MFDNTVKNVKHDKNGIQNKHQDNEDTLKIINLDFTNLNFDNDSSDNEECNQLKGNKPFLTKSIKMVNSKNSSNQQKVNKILDFG